MGALHRLGVPSSHPPAVSADLPAGPDAPSLLETALECAPVVLFQLDQAGTIVLFTGAGLHAIGIHPGSLVGGSALEIFGDVPVAEDDGRRAPFREIFARVMRGDAVHGRTLYSGVHHETHYVPSRDARGTVVGLVGVATDVSARVRAESELRQSEARYRSLALAASQSVWTTDAAGRLVSCPELEPLTGIRVDTDEGWGWLRAVHPDEREAVCQQWLASVRSSRPYAVEYRARMRDGVYRLIAARGVPVLDDAGVVREWVGTFHDVTDRQRVEDQLRQSQRMEALGRLAGGVAHDFNNLLTVINGFADLLLGRLATDALEREDLELIHRAGQRASVLTQQLLAFSRKQVMRPEPLSLNATIAEVERMLSRLLGDDVTMAVSLQPDAGTVLADPGQIQQVLMNLAVNARDAMPRGGTLTLRTRNVDVSEGSALYHHGLAPGPCVSVSVTDTGLGMTPDVRARLFEPFFTTKEPGKGTGLGLSSVYGVVRQSGGHIWVESELGVGSTFTLFFPRVAAPSVAHTMRAEAPVAGGDERILIVEDADAVGRLAHEVLRAYGYRVATVTSGADALDAIAAGGAPDLLLTDVVLPGISGPALASRVAASTPGLAVLFMSGYSDDMLGHHGVVDPTVRFLQKPFSPLALARAVREALDSRRAAPEHEA